jgi:hypothetical protein
VKPDYIAALADNENLAPFKHDSLEVADPVLRASPSLD